jgi:hypothetical protein
MNLHAETCGDVKLYIMFVQKLSSVSFSFFPEQSTDYQELGRSSAAARRAP